MADTSDFRNGMTIDADGTLLQIVYFQHVKPGKGGAFVRTKLKNVLSGAVVERTFRAGEKVNEVRLVRRPIQYSYSDGDLFYFMDMETYESIPLSRDTIGEDQLKYLQENMECEGLTREGAVLTVELPQFVELEVLALGLDPSKVYDVHLVITEAVTNSIVHGYQKQPGLIEIEVQADGDAVVLTLRDDGPTFDPLQVPSPDFGTPFLVPAPDSAGVVATASQTGRAGGHPRRDR